ncbi:MAG: hypothetical protein KIT18_02410 [Burkholderiales bacterium]|nr:hypothetical protein [Burkholderiales bacterium]
MMLLSDRQLILRVRAKYPADLTTQIEFDYRRDLGIAQGEVAVAAVALWALPLGVLCGIGVAVTPSCARAARMPGKTRPASHSDSRYRM